MTIRCTANLPLSTRVIRRAGEVAKAPDERVDPEPIDQAVDAGQQRVETEYNAQIAREAAAA